MTELKTETPTAATAAAPVEAPAPAELDRLLTQPTRKSAAQLAGEYQFIHEFAKGMHQSKLAKSDGQDLTEAQIEAVMMAGSELGLGPVEAIQSLPVIRGKIGMGAQLMLSLFLERCPGASYRVVESTDKRCEIVFARNGQAPMPVVFDIAEAVRGQVNKPNGGYDKWPKDMCWARCVSRAARRYWPDILRGVSYTPEELSEIEPAELTERQAQTKAILDDFLGKQAPKHEPPPEGTVAAPATPAPADELAAGRQVFLAAVRGLAARDLKGLDLLDSDIVTLWPTARALAGSTDRKAVAAWTVEHGKVGAATRADGSLERLTLEANA